MERKEIERILKESGFRKTVSVPDDVIDYQRSPNFKKKVLYNRIILYREAWEKLTRESLEELMNRGL